MALPETRYATNNGMYLAYQQAGGGPVDIVMLTQWFSNVESQWDVPPLAEWMDDLRAVMDDSGVEQAVLVANLASSFMAMVFGDLSRPGAGPGDGQRVPEVHPGR